MKNTYRRCFSSLLNPIYLRIMESKKRNIKNCINNKNKLISVPNSLRSLDEVGNVTSARLIDIRSRIGSVVWSSLKHRRAHCRAPLIYCLAEIKESAGKKRELSAGYPAFLIRHKKKGKIEVINHQKS